MSNSSNYKQNIVPRFYFPNIPSQLNSESHIQTNNALMNKISHLFENKEFLTEREFVTVTDACSLPRYMNIAFFRAIDSINTAYPPNEKITFERFERGWSMLTKDFKQNKIDYIIYSILKKPGFDCITPDDFLPVLEDIVVNHPALQFLENNINFQERYIETVICRIFYQGHCPSGKMYMKHFCASKFPSIIQAIDPNVDLYTTHNLFSYKQFYVLYCKLWSLDTDHDLSLSENDLSNYNLGTLTHLSVERILKIGHIAAFTESAPTPDLEVKPPLNINYFDFIWFLLSEVDKSTPMAIDYWFRCLDTDEDGILSGYELYNFWLDQDMKLRFYGDNASESTIQFADIMRQMDDLIQPETAGQFSLKDLKKNRFMAERFFDTFINFDRFQVHDSHQEGSIREQQYFERTQCEESDFKPTVLIDDFGLPVLSNWDDYADFEYDRIILDESYANNSSCQNEVDEGESYKTENAHNDLANNEEIITINSYNILFNEAESTLDDDIVIERVNDASSISFSSFMHNTDASEYSATTSDLCDLNDDYSDSSSISSICSRTSIESGSLPLEIHSDTKFFSEKTVGTLSPSNNLISLSVGP